MGKQEIPNFSIGFLMMFLCLTLIDFNEILLVIFYVLQPLAHLRNIGGVVFLFSQSCKYFDLKKYFFLNIVQLRLQNSQMFLIPYISHNAF